MKRKPLLYMVCDVGGTNTTVGLVIKQSSTYTLKAHAHYKSQEIDGIIPALQHAHTYFQKEYDAPTRIPISVSASGPTDGEYCHPSNLTKKEWLIKKKDIENTFDAPVVLINDFAAVAYSLMILNTNSNHQLYHMPQSPKYESTKNNEATIKLVIGAGTGLGIATLYTDENHTALVSTEGGWADFAPSDALSLAFYRCLSKDATQMCCWEDVISGSRGIMNICKFFVQKDPYTNTYYHPAGEQAGIALAQLLQSHKDSDIPSMVSTLAQTKHTACAEVMKFWTYLYARCCSNTALYSLPYGGVYIGGGIAAKNIQFFVEDNHFMDNFHKNTRGAISELLMNMPVYIITDYHSSLYGNAYYIHTHMTKS